MNHKIVVLLLLLSTVTALSGCHDIVERFTGNETIKKALEALPPRPPAPPTPRPLSPEAEKAIREATILCHQLAEELKARGYTVADFGSLSSENKERVQLCSEIVGAAWENWAAKDPKTYAAILGALTAAERDLLGAVKEGDTETLNNALFVFTKAGEGRADRFLTALELLNELSTSK